MREVAWWYGLESGETKGRVEERRRVTDGVSTPGDVDGWTGGLRDDGWGRVVYGNRVSEGKGRGEEVYRDGCVRVGSEDEVRWPTLTGLEVAFGSEQVQ